ncbi:MAG: hypothetical protein Q9201_005191 [Fulgogasparrea decipioides]
MTAYDRVFAAVFPPPSEHSLPTPAATPQLGSAGFEGSPEAQLAVDWSTQDSATEQVRWERAWHTATTFLSLPSEELPSSQDRLPGKWWKKYTPDIENSIRYLVSPGSQGVRLRRHQKQHDLLQWYFEEVGLRHFVHHVRPLILKVLREEDCDKGINGVLSYLERAHMIYLHNVDEYVLPQYEDEGQEGRYRIKSNLTGLLTFSLPQKKINENIADFIKTHAEAVLGIRNDCSDTAQQQTRQNIRRFVAGLQDNGLGGYRLQKILAEVMSDTLTAYIKQAYAGQWQSDANVTAQLRYWVENRFARYIVEVLATLNTSRNPQPESETEIALADVEKWQEIAINRLGALRTEELFSVIVEWEHDSKGAIEDLRRYVTTTDARTHLTSTFVKVLNRRLLQPGAATTEIMQMYISIIRAFVALDPKGVLLERVARPIRRYLRERDDTVSIVVASLLADPEDRSPSADVLPELADEMAHGINPTAPDDDDDDFDFNDMEWTPAPVDAGPDYKSSKHLDVIGSLISLFETKDVFVKNFQKVLGERLLRIEQNFDKEIRILELLKLRFGEAPLQACEVMLRDIIDSRRVDTVIRNDQNLTMSDTDEPQSELHTRILSHLFWPSLHSESFSLPPAISSLQSRYATGFETLKQSRKLTWLNALGQVTVHLDLEDRTVTEIVQTWQASVIYAFQNPHQDAISSESVEKTVQQLMSELSMSESYVRNALTFWVGKLVLARSSAKEPDTYHVLETLPSSALHPELPTSTAASTLLTAAAAADAATSAPAPAVRSEEEVMREKMEVFWQFVNGMLTNQGAMPLGRIVMMLKVVVPGGFPFGNEELKGYLERRVREGKLEVVGGNYKIKN